MAILDIKIKDSRKTYEAKYTLQELLNEGGNAWVCKCVQKNTNEEYAIKILQSGKQGEKLSRFVNEIAVMKEYGGVRNGVLPIIDADAENGWYVMPIAMPIEKYFAETNAGIKDKIEAVVRLAQSLEALHEKGITHRDIKPDNLFQYQDGYCFGDFGLCEYPDGEKVDTRTDKQLGAFNTIAPEMYTNPKGRDGRMADVYSLAKTLWILLTGEVKGFSGPYSSEDSINGFANFEHLKDEQLALIELVLQEATDNNPLKRMPLEVFRRALETWTKYASESRYVQHYEWSLMMSHISSEAYVDLKHVFDLQQIIYVLNMIANRKILNHVMLPDGGGLDLTYAEKANEEGCVYLHMQMQTILVRPKALVIATYKKSDWNFILLETEPQEPVTERHGEYDELVVEDIPGHYVSGEYARYGVYDYDSGEKLPDGYRILERQLKGSFMIVPKQGYYNNITSTYDGRHSNMTGVELYRYVDELIKGKDPKPNYEDLIDGTLKEYNRAPNEFTKKCIEEMWIALVPTERTNESRISYAIYVEDQRFHSYVDMLSDRRMYLTKEGCFRWLEAKEESVHRVYSREEVMAIRKTLLKQFEASYTESGYDFDELDCNIGVTLRREGDIEPRRFTLEQIREMMRAADDRVSNKLVIDEYGRAKIIQRMDEAVLYPVTQEAWDAGNIYVGKYSTLSDAEQSYQYMLSGWLTYIKYGRRRFVDDADEEVSALEKEIEQCYQDDAKKTNIKENMRVLEVSRYKKEYEGHCLPFVVEQGESLHAAGCEVEYFLVRGNYVKAVGALKKKIREFKPDVVHAHYGLSAITAELQSLVPVVTTFHNGETLNPVVNFASSLMSLRAKHVIYVAQHVRDLSYFKARNYSIIPCGVPMEQMIITPKEEARCQLGWDADKKYILFGGAFDNLRKNYALLRSAVEKLYENYKENTFGENNKYINQKNIKKIEESSDTCSISNNLNQMSAQEQVLGQPSVQSCSIDSVAQTLSNDSSTKKPKNILSKADTMQWIKVEGGEQYVDIVCIEMKGLSRAECVLRMCACDLFALPSHSEGSPQALKEAMAVNCPCLATDIADVRVLFGDEPGHWILRNPRKTHERWDGDENSLCEMMELLKEALAFEGRTKGRERILELGFSNEQVAQRIIEIYEEILKK